MSTRTVRILVEDKEAKTLHWYASFEADDDELDLAVIPNQSDGTVIRVVATNGGNILTTFSDFVTQIDLAVELYNTFHASIGNAYPMWNTLDQKERSHWLAMAKRVTQLGPVFTGATAEKPRTFLDERFDSTTVD